MIKQLFLLLLVTAGFLLHSNGIQAKELADIIIIPFVNETKKTEYQWLSKNIPDAVLESMKQQFEFNLLPAERLDAGLKKINRSSASLSKKILSGKEAAELCAAAEADIAVYGSYIYVQDINSIKVSILIFHKSEGKQTASFEEITPISGQMFTMADIAALRVVNHLREVALAASSAPEEQPADQKIVLEKTKNPYYDYLALGFYYKGITSEWSTMTMWELENTEFEAESVLHSIGLSAEMLFNDRMFNLRMVMAVIKGDAYVKEKNTGESLESQDLNGFRGIITIGYSPIMWESFRPWIGLNIQTAYLDYPANDVSSGNTSTFNLNLFYYGALIGLDYYLYENILLSFEAGMNIYFGHGTLKSTSNYSIDIGDMTTGSSAPHIAFNISYLINMD